MEEVLGIVAPVPKGQWNNITAYEQLNIVRHNNTLYIAKQNVPASIEPTVSPNWTDYWMLLMSPLSATDIVEQVYPVGSLYISANSTDPAITYGGTWEQITDCFILAASDVSAENPDYVGGATGGSATHLHNAGSNLSANVHLGANSVYFDGIYHPFVARHAVLGTGSQDGTWTPAEAAGISGYTENASSMPPYKAFYVWQRIA
ncbi:MAG: hypothetical protein IJQ23_03360 [Clostridia bacterium]|nr:hypothetical protein [Clostridia bacterium]